MCRLDAENLAVLVATSPLEYVNPVPFFRTQNIAVDNAIVTPDLHEGMEITLFVDERERTAQYPLHFAGSPKPRP